ncbi:hypothetical protein Tco_1058846, partial [Tanacetum coccineum]
MTKNAMHNDIMKAGSKDRPLMLALGSYVQWKSRIMDTLQQNQHTNNSDTELKMLETYDTIGADKKDLIDVEAEDVQIILTWIGNDIYSIVDACPNDKEIWRTRISRIGSTLDIHGLIQEVLPENDEDIGPSYDTKPLEKVDSNITPTSLNMSNNEGELKAKKLNNELKKANTSLANELEKYKHFKHKEEAELECAKSYGLLAETKMISKWHQDEAAREVYAVKQKFSKMEEQIFAHEIQILKCHLKRFTTSFANPMYLKKAQWEKPCLYKVVYDKNDLANMFAPETQGNDLLTDTNMVLASSSFLNFDMINMLSSKDIVNGLPKL